jgi:signal peptidase II
VTAGRLWFAVLAVVVFVLDRITKGLVIGSVQLGTEVNVIPSRLWIAHVQNSGAAFGVGRSGGSVFLLASVAVAIGLVVYVIKHPESPPIVNALLGLIMGGTLGNGYDRLVHGTVTDFIALHIWPVFNVADSAISVGVACLMVGYVFGRRRQRSA